MKKIFLLLFFLNSFFLVDELLAQQDAQYSMYMLNPLAINPAYAGSRDVFSSTILYRNQWQWTNNISGAPVTAYFSAQMPLRKKKIGMGFEIISDKIGPKNITASLLSYSYRIPLFKGKLSMGLKGGFYNYIFDLKKMNYRDKNDIYNTDKSNSHFTSTFDFGFLYYTRTFYCGFAFTHINRGKISNVSGDSAAKQVHHLFLSIGKAFQINENVILNPVIILKTAENATVNYDIGINMLLKERLWIGVSARKDYGLVFLTQYLINDKLKVGYSYDLGINRIGTIGKGSHEIMIGYDINIHNAKVMMPRYL
ncbi:MAG: type IX secretion system membrane protein PorP/SprF [Bacteroidota bacterium]